MVAWRRRVPTAGQEKPAASASAALTTSPSTSESKTRYLLNHALLLRFLPPPTTAEADPCVHSLESPAKPYITVSSAEILFWFES
jgi:hypothetical protein